MKNWNNLIKSKFPETVSTVLGAFNHDAWDGNGSKFKADANIADVLLHNFNHVDSLDELNLNSPHKGLELEIECYDFENRDDDSTKLCVMLNLEGYCDSEHPLEALIINAIPEVIENVDSVMQVMESVYTIDMSDEFVLLLRSTYSNFPKNDKELYNSLFSFLKCRLGL